ncbi:MAG: hypothetical protein QM666_07430 [Acinetobacter sp.]
MTLNIAPFKQLMCINCLKGAGSLIFSHVNDAALWLIKEYFGMTVGQTLKTWSVLETIISVLGLSFTLLLSAVL